MTGTNPDRKLPAIQAVRGIAASLVVFHHFARIYQDDRSNPSWIYNSGLGNLGACGVDVFFVVSGFIMVYTTMEEGGLDDALTFIKKRILRIYPLYWIWTSVLLTLWLLGVAHLQAKGSVGSNTSATYFIRSYFLIPTFNGLYFHPLLSQGWTLSFEMYFYLVFAICILLRLKLWTLPLCCLAFCTLACLGRLLPNDSGLRYLFTDPIVIEFIFGLLIGYCFTRRPNWRESRMFQRLSWVLILPGAVSLLWMVKIPHTDELRFMLFGLPALLIVSGAVLLGSSPAPRLLVYLGNCSYSIYISHGFFAMGIASALKHYPAINKLPSDLAIILFGGMTIVLSSFSYWLVERPVTKLVSTRKSSLSATWSMKPTF